MLLWQVRKRDLFEWQDFPHNKLTRLFRGNHVLEVQLDIRAITTEHTANTGWHRRRLRSYLCGGVYVKQEPKPVTTPSTEWTERLSNSAVDSDRPAHAERGR